MQTVRIADPTFVAMGNTVTKTSFLWLRIFTTAIAFVLFAGCAKTITHQVATMRPANNSTPTTQPIAEAGMYQVKIKQAGDKRYHSIEGTPRMLLPAGTVVGFRQDSNGVVYALVGQKEIRIDLPDDWESAVWFSSHTKPTQFAREVGKAVDATGKVAGVGAYLVGRGALDSLESYGDVDEDHVWQRQNRMK